MLELLKDIYSDRLNATDKKILTAAITYHDCIYEVGSSNNERLSAIALQEERSKAFYPEDMIEAMRLVLLTIHHTTSVHDTLGSIIIDLDLAGLGTDEYWSNKDKIRKEYASATDEQWLAGRAAFLTNFLSRDRIYYTEYGQENWEQKARENMNEELRQLTGE